MGPIYFQGRKFVESNTDGEYYIAVNISRRGAGDYSSDRGKRRLKLLVISSSTDNVYFGGQRSHHKRHSIRSIVGSVG